MINYRAVTDSHIKELARNARDADINEVAAMTTEGIESALRECLDHSTRSFSVFCGDDLLCIFGLAATSVLGAHNAPWMLGTKKISKHRKSFIKASIEVITWMKGQSYLLENVVHADHVEAVSWLKFLGFQFDEPQPIGLNGEKFMRFYLCAQY